MHQFFSGLAFFHSLNIVHRDLKPSNILVDIELRKLKICDFGSAKIIKSNKKSTPLVTSRFYRAPELLFGTTNYDSKIDMWSAGCVLAEMYLGHPLFLALNSDAEQIISIVNSILIYIFSYWFTYCK